MRDGLRYCSSQCKPFLTSNDQSPSTRTSSSTIGERLGVGRVEGESAEFIDIETIDQSGQHRHDTPEHLLTWVDTVNRDKALRRGSIETGSALDGRATRVVEKLGPLTPVHSELNNI